MLFFVSDIPAFGFQTYFIEVTSNKDVQSFYSKPKKIGLLDAEQIIENNYVRLYFSGSTGALSKVELFRSSWGYHVKIVLQ